MMHLPSIPALLKRSLSPAPPSAIDLTRQLAKASGDAAGPRVANALAVELGGLEDSRFSEYFAAVARELAAEWQIVIHQLNLAAGGTALLVDLRRRLLVLAKSQPELKPLERQLQQTLTSWFNGGFLTLRRIDWDSPASLLERLMRYEAVHPITSWANMRRRLAGDRRCFGFFHPAMPNDPLIFVQVALTREISQTIKPILEAPIGDDPAPTTAIFYSISNCQRGLNGIPFGNLLIKRVVTELHQELPSLTTFSTLSPIPGFRQWIERNDGGTTGLSAADTALLATPHWWDHPESYPALELPLTRAAARYLTLAPEGRAPDPVAHFHLSNGARVERINWRANLSDNGVAESYGLMVNYRYRLDHIQKAQLGYRAGKVPRAWAIDALLHTPLRMPFLRSDANTRRSVIHG
ncbi:malonyl-CoA decarboxylase family protein [Niveispirillum sp.]|uniref:malonyl-CoA decarboxylase domain-containing protein n=1 Tax=Niveispirillum sp. TaxID=1917217 RepID=UPI001B7B05DA|nr:malonyl-CoA decarboxylase family protein [Niveispirillum sp.]MBP7334277.1 malonyl-CoA decarboxylase family protein [Niveispirillum sp.]